MLNSFQLSVKQCYQSEGNTHRRNHKSSNIKVLSKKYCSPWNLECHTQNMILVFSYKIKRQTPTHENLINFVGLIKHITTRPFGKQSCDLKDSQNFSCVNMSCDSTIF